MTVCETGTSDGTLLTLIRESKIDTDEPILEFERNIGKIHSNLKIGANVAAATKLKSNNGMSANGMLLSGADFIISKNDFHRLRVEERADLISRVRPYFKGKALYDGWSGDYVIDLFGLPEEQVRTDFPEVFQHLLQTVKPARAGNIKKYREEKWWLFGENNPQYRSALAGLTRYTATIETAKHRIFQFVDGSFLHDHMVIGVASPDALLLTVLSSRIHCVWALETGGTLEDRPRYTKTVTFDPFPFPTPSETQKKKLRSLGEELDGTRKRVRAEHPDLTLTGLYNVLEKLKAGAPLTPADEDVKTRGLVLVLKDLHEKIDIATAEAYGWPANLSDEQILERLVALNAERAREEAAGYVRWLRPDYQIPRFAKEAAAPQSGDLDLAEATEKAETAKPAFPTDRYEQPLAIEAVLAAAGRPMDAEELSRAFKRGGKRIEPRIEHVLTTLTRYGRVIALENKRYAARRAA